MPEHAQHRALAGVIFLCVFWFLVYRRSTNETDTTDYLSYARYYYMVSCDALEPDSCLQFDDQNFYGQATIMGGAVVAALGLMANYRQLSGRTIIQSQL